MEAELAAAGFEAGSQIQQQLEALRHRLTALQSSAQAMRELDGRIDDGLVELRSRHNETTAARQRLTGHRREACSRINRSMRTFFARVAPAEPEAAHEQLEALINDLVTGTHMRAADRTALRQGLQRFRLLETAVRRTQGASDGDDADPQNRLLDAALSRSKSNEVGRLACLWPGDALILAKKRGHRPPPSST